MSNSSSITASKTARISLPSLIRLLTSRGLSTKQAMEISSKLIHSKFDTMEKLENVTSFDLDDIGIKVAEERKALLGIGGKGKGKGRAARGGKANSASSPNKRPRPSLDHNPLLPSGPSTSGHTISSDLHIDEILDEKVLLGKSVVINRAPVMTAWSFVVAEKLGFKRQEALSIAHVYTELNAISKGTSLGILSPPSADELPSDSQPYVLLMNRRIPVLSLQTSEWRALSKGTISQPEVPYSYMQRSFRQMFGAVLGAMRLLAESVIEGEALNKIGYDLYCEFRPDVDGWGKKGEVRLSKILELRKSKLKKTKGKMTLKKEESELNLKTDEVEIEEQDGVDLNNEDEKMEKMLNEEIDWGEVDV